MRPGLDRALEHLARTPVLVVACDFDGTLSPIVSDPASATPDRRALEPLDRLAALPRTYVVVISGRSRDDLRRRLGTARRGIDLIGSHGAESGDGAASAARGAVTSLEESLGEVVGSFPGAEIEVKPFGVAFHFRRVRDPDQESARRSALERGDPLAHLVKEGKKVVEFLTIPADKGRALERYRIERGATATLFVGDDTTDEAAFGVLAAGDVGVKVGPGPTAASHRLAAQENVAAMLASLSHHRSEWIQIGA